MPYFRYDDYASIVTDLKNKRRLVTKRNKMIRRLAEVLQKCSDYLYEKDLNYDLIYEIDQEIQKCKQANIVKDKGDENVCT